LELLSAKQTEERARSHREGPLSQDRPSIAWTRTVPQAARGSSVGRLDARAVRHETAAGKEIVPEIALKLGQVAWMMTVGWLVYKQVSGRIERVPGSSGCKTRDRRYGTVRVL